MTNWGTIILNAYKKSQPMLLDGTLRVAKNSRFSLKNPYILEALPDNIIMSTRRFEGKKLNTVCRVIDNPELISRYNNFCALYNNGFNANELLYLFKKAFPNGKVPTFANEDAMVFLSKLDYETGSRFDAHGIAKISITDQLKQLNTILSKGIDKTKGFHTAPLVGKADIGAGLGTAGSAYRDGSFILVSGKGKSLVSDGIETVIVNDAYYSIINDLKLKFPKVNFVKAEDSVNYFEKLVAKY